MCQKPIANIMWLFVMWLAGLQMSPAASSLNGLPTAARGLHLIRAVCLRRENGGGESCTPSYGVLITAHTQQNAIETLLTQKL